MFYEPSQIKTNKGRLGLARAGQHQKNFDLQGTSGGGGGCGECGGVVIIVVRLVVKLGGQMKANVWISVQ